MDWVCGFVAFRMKNVQYLGDYEANTKGQLISEWNFGVFKSPKKPNKFLTDFCPMKLGQKSVKYLVAFFGRFEDSKNSFWDYLTFSYRIRENLSWARTLIWISHFHHRNRFHCRLLYWKILRIVYSLFGCDVIL